MFNWLDHHFVFSTLYISDMIRHDFKLFVVYTCTVCFCGSVYVLFGWYISKCDW